MASSDLASLFVGCRFNGTCCTRQQAVGTNIISAWRAQAEKELTFYSDYAAQHGQNTNGLVTISSPGITMIVDVTARRLEIDGAASRALEYLNALTSACVQFALRINGG